MGSRKTVPGITEKNRYYENKGKGVPAARPLILLINVLEKRDKKTSLNNSITGTPLHVEN